MGSVAHRSCTLFLCILCACGVSASPNARRDAANDTEASSPLPDVFEPTDQREIPLDALFTRPDSGASDGAANALPPPYPIVLHHGFAGFRDIGPVNYFYNVARDLRSRGHVVYETEVSPFLPPSMRAYQLAQQIDRVRAETRHHRVVVIGHSQGGIDARYLISTLRYGDRIPLLVTIATPHRGTRVADAVLDRVPNLFDGFIDAVASVFGFAYNEVRTNADLRQTLQSLSETSAEEFNRQNPNDPSVVYWSWTGRSNRRNGELQCSGARFPNDPSRVDDINPLLLPFARILEQNDPAQHVNDGMVEVASARWGIFMGCIPADHFDEVGQIARSGPVPGSGFDHLAFYRSVVEQIRSAGY